MNRKQTNRKTINGKRRRKSSAHEKWLKYLKAKYGAFQASGPDADKQLMVLYETQVPPRMPKPGGPAKGAAYTTVQLVRGSDMTLPTGSAVVGALIRQNTAADVFASYEFCLADIPNAASVGALFDVYRIDEIQFRLRTRNPGVTVQAAAAPNYATTGPIVVIDRDDNTAPATLLELQQYDNAIEMSAQDSLDIVFKPSVTPAVFGGGAFSGYAVEESDGFWIDMANTSVPHYGIHLGIPALVATTTQRFDWDVEAWYKISFKNTR